jgi:hypothetical protein
MGQIVIVNQIGQNIDDIRMGHQIFQSVRGSVCMCGFSGRKERKRFLVITPMETNEVGPSQGTTTVGWFGSSSSTSYL